MGGQLPRAGSGSEMARSADESSVQHSGRASWQSSPGVWSCQQRSTLVDDVSHATVGDQLVMLPLTYKALDKSDPQSVLEPGTLDLQGYYGLVRLQVPDEQVYEDYLTL